MQRYLQEKMREDSASKIILLSGPRQCGKTTLSKELFSDYTYLNYDLAEDRERIAKKHWRRDTQALILDELHKMPEWKRYLKGIYDTEGLSPRLLVTGSANMDAFTKVGDSLAGRYFQFRLHPIDIKEAVTLGAETPNQAAETILTVGGFPEPFLKGSESFYRRWRRTHLDVILRQDFIDLTAIRSIKSIELLVDLLAKRVASPVSFRSLAEDLQVDPKTVKAWSLLLENFYVLFRITPYHRNLARALLKEPKFYFFDVPRAGGLGQRLENLVACALWKEVQFLQDTEGLNLNLHYLKTSDGKEIDFIITHAEEPVLCCEVKAGDMNIAKTLSTFHSQFKPKASVQLVYNATHEFDTAEGVQLRDLAKFLADFSLMRYL